MPLRLRFKLANILTNINIALSKSTPCRLVFFISNSKYNVEKKINEAYEAL